MSFAQNLQSVMDEHNLNQTDLSHLTGSGKPSLSQYLSGKNVPHKRRIAEIANALGVPINRLTGIIQAATCENPPLISGQKISIEEAARRLGKSRWTLRCFLASKLNKRILFYDFIFLVNSSIRT